MHRERLRENTRPQPADEVPELLALLAGYRWRFGRALLSRLVVRGGIAAELLVALASGLSWLV